MKPDELTWSEKTIIMSLVAKELSQLEQNNAPEEKVIEFERIIVKLERT